MPSSSSPGGCGPNSTPPISRRRSKSFTLASGASVDSLKSPPASDLIPRLFWSAATCRRFGSHASQRFLTTKAATSRRTPKEFRRFERQGIDRVGHEVQDLPRGKRGGGRSLPPPLLRAVATG